MDALIKKGLRLFQNSSKMRVNIVSMDALIKKGLRRRNNGNFDFVVVSMDALIKKGLRLAGFGLTRQKEVSMDALIKKGLRPTGRAETGHASWVSMDALIKKGLRRSRKLIKSCLTRFDGRPDQEGIKTHCPLKHLLIIQFRWTP